MNKPRSHTLPKGFISAYDPYSGVEVFEDCYEGILHRLAQVLNVWVFSILSTRCFHQWGGAKMMLRELRAWMKPGDFVFKTDVYSYYASLNHTILLEQLHVIEWPRRLLETVLAYCQRTILSPGLSLHCKTGIPKGGVLSPALGALYLTPLDTAMERWMARGDCFYARFQDDIILVARKRHLLRGMRKEMYGILDELRLGLRPEKTFMGRSQKGFDLLGYHITPDSFSPSNQTQEKAFERAKRRYVQGGQRSLHEYLKRWRTWVHAGLPFPVYHVEEIIDEIRVLVTNPKHQWNSQSTTHSPTCSVSYGFNQSRKGKMSCINQNFSGHY